MAEKRETPGFVIYREAAIMLALMPAEDAAAAIKAACDYFLRGTEPPELDGFAAHVYETLQEGIARSEKKYIEKSERNRKKAENRWKKADADALPQQCDGNAAAMQQQCNGNATALPQQCHGNANQNQNQNYNPEPKTKTRTTGDNARKERATPPTLESVMEYAEQRGSDVDPRQFWEYYTAGDWKDAKGNPVRNWKQKFITWEKHETPKGAAPARAKTNPAIGTPGDYEREAIARLHRMGANE